ncbi:PREDICTED: leucine-rich repeat-containing protein PRAME-like [Galeopterus variegatus]|uniref:Leucine-rich repeat-containing protein PRAME-like n=1 Tax=Galeopterus variegatus TaxID=482537 RepID=A0ABM0RET9_GALVR|nr:PREDICTED: leucine-rich repeat-containing protein PRAME-like [Galeopterus variegatus]
MDKNAPATLLALAARGLLSNERAAIHALEELPSGLFAPLFTAAFLGGHKKVLKAMVRIWPFPCLHIGTLSVRESQYDNFEAMIDGLQILPARDSSSWTLISDRVHYGAEGIEDTVNRFASWHSIMKQEEAQHRVRCLGIVNSESEPQSSREPVELLVDISLDGTLRTGRFLSLLRNKVQQSFGSLHLCCRDLQIDGRLAHEHILQLLNMGCIGHLKVNEIYLSQVTTLLSQMTHLHSLSMSHITFTSCMRRSFGTVLTRLRQMNTLQQIRLSSCRTHPLHELLRCLPPQLDALYLSFCGLSDRHITVLAQSPAALHLRLLSLCNNEISWELSESFQTLLASVSGTLQHLEIDNCLMTDSALTAVIPALSRCSHLRVFSFASNPITMRALTSLLQHLTKLMELKCVIYPVPVHCYERLHDPGSLNRLKLSEVQAQLKAMLQVVKRNDMRWTTSPE